MTQALWPMLNDEDQKMICGSSLYEAISDCKAHLYCKGGGAIPFDIIYFDPQTKECQEKAHF